MAKTFGQLCDHLQAIRTV